MARGTATVLSHAVVALCLGVLFSASNSHGVTQPAPKTNPGWELLSKAFGTVYDYNSAGLDSFFCEFRSSLFQEGTDNLRRNYKYADSGMQCVDSVTFRIGFAPRRYFKIGYQPYRTTGHLEIDNAVFKMIAMVVQYSQNALFPWALHGSAAVAQNSFSPPVVKATAEGSELVFKEKSQTVTTVIDKKGCLAQTRIESKGSRDVVVPTFEENGGRRVLSAMEITHNNTNKVMVRFSYHEVNGYLVPLSATVSNKGAAATNEYMFHFFNYKIYGNEQS